MRGRTTSFLRSAVCPADACRRASVPGDCACLRWPPRAGSPAAPGREPRWEDAHRGPGPRGQDLCSTARPRQSPRPRVGGAAAPQGAWMGHRVRAVGESQGGRRPHPAPGGGRCPPCPFGRALPVCLTVHPRKPRPGGRLLFGAGWGWEPPTRLLARRPLAPEPFPNLPCTAGLCPGGGVGVGFSSTARHEPPLAGPRLLSAACTLPRHEGAGLALG